MRARLTGASVAAALALLAGFAPTAVAQDPAQSPTVSPSPTPTPSATPTPTPTPTPEEQAEAERDERDRESKPVRRIYRDFERDGRIDDCDHTANALKRARRSIADSYAEEYPDFRDALTAALERHRAGECEEQEVAPESESGGDTGGGTGGGDTGSGGSGGGTSPGTLDTTPPPPPPPVAPPAPETGTLPDFGDDSPTAPGGGGGGGGGGGDVTPLPDEGAIPEGTPSPQATPVPTPAPPVEPKLIVSQSSADPDMFVPGTMLAVALLGLLIAALTALLGRRSERFAGVAQAWREAAWRTSGTWSDFTDWLRAGR
jgi:hypothetical protein